MLPFMDHNDFISIGSVLLRDEGKLILIKSECYTSGVAVKDITSIRFSEPFKMQLTNNSLPRFWNVKEHQN